MHRIVVTAAFWIAVAPLLPPLGNAMPFTQAPASSAGQADRSLDVLRFKTGWIVLGLPTIDRRHWRLAATQQSRTKTGGFEILGRSVATGVE